MEGNKDDSEKCIRIALRCIDSGEKEKAIKFLNKAERLYPSQKAKVLLEQISELNGSTAGRDSTDGGGGGGGGEEGVRRRSGHAEREKAEPEPEPREREYTDSQLQIVKKIKKCKDYYEILGVEKDATEADLKKSYRKLALQMHPDKNKAPGATEAFKAVGNAFAVLSDADKRKKYDLYGPEEERNRRSGHGDYDYTHGFEGDISPEELFNMFFGGGFPSGNVYQRRPRQHTHRTYTRHFHHSQDTSSNESGFALILQMAPILLLVFLSLLSSFFVSDPIFSMQRTEKYSVERKTSHLRIPYFVKSDFRSSFQGDLRRIERQVEEEFVSNLRTNCWKERSYKENMLWRARNYADAKLYEKAQNMETPSCDQLQKIYS